MRESEVIPEEIYSTASQTLMWRVLVKALVEYNSGFMTWRKKKNRNKLEQAISGGHVLQAGVPLLRAFPLFASEKSLIRAAIHNQLLKRTKQLAHVIEFAGCLQSFILLRSTVGFAGQVRKEHKGYVHPN